MAVGSPRDSAAPRAMSWDGRAWHDTAAVQSPGVRLVDVSCATTTSCMAVGEAGSAGGGAQRWDGARWVETPVPDGPVRRVSCPTADACIAVVGGISDGLRSLLWDGDSWRVGPVVSTEQSSRATALSCAAPDRCALVRNDILGRNGVQWWDGAAWTERAAPPVALTPHGVSCPAVDVCWFAGSEPRTDGIEVPVVARSAAGDWTATVVRPGRAGWVDQIDCDSRSSCLAVGEMVQRGNGTSWTVVDDLRAGAAHQIWTDVSCPAATFCLLGGERDDTLLLARWDGTRLVRESLPVPAEAPFPGVRAVSCASASWCLVLGSSNVRLPTSTDLAFLWDGTAWTVTAAPQTDTAGLSCPAPDRCVAAAHNGNAAVLNTWDGARWSSATVATGAIVGALATSPWLRDVSCPSPTWCAAVGTRVTVSPVGYVDQRPMLFVGNGSRWSEIAVPAANGGAGQGLATVSCSSPSFCAAGGNATRIGAPMSIVLDGGRWKTGPALTGIPPDGSGSSITGISCEGRSCPVVGRGTGTGSGFAAVYDAGPG
jgi:hypothetical protein